MEPPKNEMVTFRYERFQRWKVEQWEGSREGQAILEENNSAMSLKALLKLPDIYYLLLH